MSVTRVAYAVDGWGEGELWFDGETLLWHELPQPRARGPVRSAVRRRRPVASGQSFDLVGDVERYFRGERVRFDDVVLGLDGWTPFQRAVAGVLRTIPWGEVVSYAELARSAGYPNAQRAAGTFCAQNRFPLVVPCHRVVSASGIGGYGSLGAEYKRRLLELEGVAL